uniref:Uncharacterized protein n=1 Tax=Anguilla anguilla TaxID=7936 RepID=A0A0E9VUM7_ANGAN
MSGVLVFSVVAQVTAAGVAGGEHPAPEAAEPNAQ